jgi:hypothetical protein
MIDNIFGSSESDEETISEIHRRIEFLRTQDRKCPNDWKSRKRPVVPENLSSNGPQAPGYPPGERQGLSDPLLGGTSGYAHFQNENESDRSALEETRREWNNENRVTVRLKRETSERLREYSKATNVNISFWIREAVAKFLAEKSADSEPRNPEAIG